MLEWSGESSEVVYMCAVCQHLAHSKEEIAVHVETEHADEHVDGTIMEGGINEGDYDEGVDAITDSNTGGVDSDSGIIGTDGGPEPNSRVVKANAEDNIIVTDSESGVIVMKPNPGVIMTDQSSEDIMDYTPEQSSESDSNQQIQYIVASPQQPQQQRQHIQYVELIHDDSQAQNEGIAIALDNNKIVKYMHVTEEGQLVQQMQQQHQQVAQQEEQQIVQQQQQQIVELVGESKQEVVQYVIDNAEMGDGDSLLMVVENNEAESEDNVSVKVEPIGAVGDQQSEFLPSQTGTEKTEADTLEAASVLTGMGQEGTVT